MDQFYMGTDKDWKHRRNWMRLLASAAPDERGQFFEALGNKPGFVEILPGECGLIIIRGPMGGTRTPLDAIPSLRMGLDEPNEFLAMRPLRDEPAVLMPMTCPVEKSINGPPEFPLLMRIRLYPNSAPFVLAAGNDAASATKRERIDKLNDVLI